MRTQSIKSQTSVLFIILFIFCIHPAYGENKIKTGMDFPDITLEGSDCIDGGQYLGVKNNERFMDISKIPAKLIIIEFFNVYCPVCQKQAPVANKLYKIIQRNTDKRG
jgi:thiol-disulfide isomerase/thioredoxin